VPKLIESSPRSFKEERIMARTILLALAISSLLGQARALAADDEIEFVLSHEIDRRFADASAQAVSESDDILEFAFPLSREVARYSDRFSREWLIKSQEQRKARIYSNSLASDVAMRFSDEGATQYR
jgi:hypothetical protein